MLRRKPTAITITNEDIIAFEESRLRQQEQQEQQASQSAHKNVQHHQQQQQQYQSSSSPQSGLDPSDELKPLPGDKARIVRGREERLTGASGRRG